MSTTPSTVPLEEVRNPYRVDEPLGESTTPPAESEVVQNAPQEGETTSEVVQNAPQQTEKPSEQQTEEEKPTVLGGKHYSRKELAEKLEKSDVELERLRSEGQMRTQQYTDALAKQEDLEKSLKERDEDFVKARTPVYDWKQDPMVAAPRREIAELVTDSAAEMTPEIALTFRQDLHKIVAAYGEARGLGDGALRAFRDKLTEHFGEDGPKIFSATKQIFPKYRAASEAEEKNSIGHFDNTRENYEKRRRTAVEDFSKIGRWTEDQIKASPDDPDAIISAAVGGDEELLKSLEAVAHKAAQASVGLPPLPPKATPEMVAQYRAAERNREQFLNTAHRRDVQVRALTAVVKHLLDERNTLLKRVTSAAPGNRAEITSESTPKREQTTVPQGGDFSEIPNPYRGT